MPLSAVQRGRPEAEGKGAITLCFA
uniref:Uncharacterized protein n=1 Tax=Rhizophora mucronata TaxID=61149 RepID=A0A2P2P7T4_RHIMU